MKPNTLTEALTEALGYSASNRDIFDATRNIATMPGSKLQAFFVGLSDAFMDIYDDDSSRSDAKQFAAELQKLSKIAQRVN